MFSFGIFTTHIPYLAFVAFYAYFLLFGISKASAGELQSGETKFKTEFHAAKHYSGTNNPTYKLSKADFALFRLSNLEELLLQRTPNHPFFVTCEYQQGHFSADQFSRPPPLA